MVCLRLHQNVKQSDSGYLINLFYILCRHFDDKTKPKKNNKKQNKTKQKQKQKQTKQNKKKKHYK